MSTKLIDIINNVDVANGIVRNNTPYTIFISENRSQILTNLKSKLGRKPLIVDIRLAFQKEWDNLPFDEKKIYISKAVSLGYVGIGNINGRQQLTLKARLAIKLQTLKNGSLR